MRLIAIIANIAIFFYGNPEVSLGNYQISVFDLIITVIAAALYIVFIVSTASEALAWRKVDLYPTSQQGEKE